MAIIAPVARKKRNGLSRFPSGNEDSSFGNSRSRRERDYQLRIINKLLTTPAYHRLPRVSKMNRFPPFAGIHLIYARKKRKLRVIASR